MGVVYAARHAIIDKRVAIKVLRKERAPQDESAGAALHRRGEGGVEDRPPEHRRHHRLRRARPTGSAYFVMEFLDGPTLGKLVHEPSTLAAAARDRASPSRSRAGSRRRTTRASSTAISSRRTSSSSSATARSDVVKIVDFGIAKDVKARKQAAHRRSGMVLGTPEYMSPEQATGQETDHRVDSTRSAASSTRCSPATCRSRARTRAKTLTMHVFEPVMPPSQLRPDLRHPAGARGDRAAACCRRSRTIATPTCAS